MTAYIILALCVLVILSYIFDITSKYSKIPGVILLIVLGIGIQMLGEYTNLAIPNLKPVLPVLGTLGLVMIILEASLDLKIEKQKKVLIAKSVSSAFILFAIFTVGFAYVLSHYFGYSVRSSILNGIPLGIISSSVAIPSAIFLNSDEKEFIVYESSFSDIFGVLIFNFIVVGQTSVLKGILTFSYNIIITMAIALCITSVLAILLHKIKHHVHHVLIITSVVTAYILAEIYHFPALLLIITFGIVMSNNKLLENTYIKRWVDFPKFGEDLVNFRKMMGEFTFLIRSFFFIIFGYYTQIKGLFSGDNILLAVSLTGSLFILRLIFLKWVIKMPVMPLLLFSPRGLITILLFLSIPVTSRIPLISDEVITLVILMSIFILMIGNIFIRKEKSTVEKEFSIQNLYEMVSEETMKLRILEERRVKEQETNEAGF